MPLSPVPIDVQALTKFYGARRGVERLSFTVECGEILGFLGPNGSGKTTTIRVLMGLLLPSSGKASVLGLDAMRDTVAIKRRVGYLPGDVALYGERTGEELLRFVLRLRGIARSHRAEEVADLLDATMDRPLKKCSRGMRQKVALVLTMAHDPDVLILDEPTSGLDPLAQRGVLDILRHEQERGKSILFSSHALWEAEEICNRVAILREGRLIALENVGKLRERKYKVVTIAYSGMPPNLHGLDDTKIVWEQEGRIAFRVRGNINLLLDRLADCPLEDVTITEPSLEEVFLDYYQETGR